VRVVDRPSEAVAMATVTVLVIPTSTSTSLHVSETQQTQIYSGLLTVSGHWSDRLTDTGSQELLTLFLFNNKQLKQEK